MTENLKANRDPVGKLAAGDAPWFQEGNVQIHASFKRIKDAFFKNHDGGFFAGWGADFPDKDVLTSLSLSLSPDYWQATFNMPVEEIKPTFGCGEILQSSK